MKVASFHSWAHCEGSGVAYRIQGGHSGVFLKSQHSGGGSRRIGSTKLSLSASQVQGPHGFCETWLKIAQSIRGSVGEVKGLVSCFPRLLVCLFLYHSLSKDLREAKQPFQYFLFSLSLYLYTNDIITVIEGIWNMVSKLQIAPPQTP